MDSDVDEDGHVIHISKAQSEKSGFLRCVFINLTVSDDGEVVYSYIGSKHSFPWVTNSKELLRYRITMVAFMHCDIAMESRQLSKLKHIKCSRRNNVNEKRCMGAIVKKFYQPLLIQIVLVLLRGTKPANALLGNLFPRIGPPLANENRDPSKNFYSEATVAAEPLSIRIRSTSASDLSTVAALLSTASVGSPKGLGAHAFNWRQKMDALWAKADIEALLRVRLEALHEGRKRLHHLQSIPDLEEQDRLRLLWSNERLRNRIATASRQTGESNVWQSHNFALTPDDSSWMNHVQMTAEDVSTGQVIGFCEVAMLSNPVAILENDDGECVFGYSPAITNLATDPDFRRQGVATRLLRTAERVVRRKWQANSIGLYVEKENKGALALYRSRGFEPKKPCEGGDRLGEMWYMMRSWEETSAPLQIEG